MLICSYCGRRGTRAFSEFELDTGRVWCASATACRRRRDRLIAAGRSRTSRR